MRASLALPHSSPGVRSLRGPAADPRRGDRTPCGAAAPRGAGAGARAAAGAARPRRLTRARSRPPPAPSSPSVRGPGGAGFGPHLTDLTSPSRRLAGLSAARYTPPTVVTRRPTVMTRRLGGHQAVWQGHSHCLRSLILPDGPDGRHGRTVTFRCRAGRAARPCSAGIRPPAGGPRRTPGGRRPLSLARPCRDGSACRCRCCPRSPAPPPGSSRCRARSA